MYSVPSISMGLNTPGMLAEAATHRSRSPPASTNRQVARFMSLTHTVSRRSSPSKELCGMSSRTSRRSVVWSDRPRRQKSAWKVRSVLSR